MKDALVVLTAEQLEALVSRAVTDALAKCGAMPEAPPDILNCKQVAALIGVHPDTVPRLTRKANALPVFGRVGPELRFRRADVLNWMAARRNHA